MQIGTLDDIDEVRDMFTQQALDRSKLLEELALVSNEQESLMYQKSRLTWLKEGDFKTSFFHNTVNWFRRVNGIRGVNVNDTWVEDQLRLKQEVKNFFEQRYIEHGGPRMSLEEVPFKQIDSEDNEMLCANFFFQEKIRCAVWECNDNKCPGLDAQNFNFIKGCWQVIKEDILKVVNEFHHNGTLPRGVNATFVSLIPKVNKLVKLCEWKPH